MSSIVKGKIDTTPEILAMADAISRALNDTGYGNPIRMAAAVIAYLERQGYELSEIVNLDYLNDVPEVPSGGPD